MRALSLLIIDNTSTFRLLVKHALERLKGFRKTGAFSSLSEALRYCESERVDIVILDVFIDGVSLPVAIRELGTRAPGALVILASGKGDRHSREVKEGLASGAFGFISKPDFRTYAANIEAMASSIASMLPMIYDGLKRKKKLFSSSPGENFPDIKKLPKFNAGLLVVAVSTGGPEALGQFIPDLPASFPIPVLLVQHMPAVFTASLAETLDRISTILVTEARGGEIPKPGVVYIAPGDLHMTLESNLGKYMLRIRNGEKVNGCRPSADVLFESIAKNCSVPVLCVVLTGMGNDGARGVEALKEGECYCVTQSERTCSIYGMPAVVDKKGLSDLSVDIEDMGAVISRLVSG